MYQVWETLSLVRDFMELGGDVLWGVFAISVLMWTFLLERMWYYRKLYPGRREEIFAMWRARADDSSWYAKRIRDGLVSELQMDINQNLLVIRTCISILPLIGLLGTVTGMIQVFDVMAYTGAGNARLMAGGVSAATIPTMSGLVAALSGLAVGSRLFGYAHEESMRVADSLRHE